MHSAPSVSYPVGRFVGWCALQVTSVLLLAGVAMVLTWQAQHGLLPVSVIGSAGLLSAVWLWRAWCAAPAGVLAWAQSRDGRSGGAWFWRTDDTDAIERVVELSVMLLLQDHMCLSIQVAGQGRRTVWLSAASAPARWHGMRQALWAMHSGDGSGGVAGSTHERSAPQ